MVRDYEDESKESISPDRTTQGVLVTAETVKLL
jgi:hypothetical protein